LLFFILLLSSFDMNFSVTRTLLVLGRVSNLPTVWTNGLAGWWLGGGGNLWKLPFLLVGMSLLYTGGMFLNDAFDIEFDRQRRPERPIPTGKIAVQLVWRLGLGQLGLGVLLLFFCGKVAAIAAVLLALTILIYDATHKFFTAAPWLMGACRFWVYVIAGAASAKGLSGLPIFCGAAMAFYIVGLSYVARRESSRSPIPFWSLMLLVAPIILAMVINNGSFRLRAVWMAIVLILWFAYCARPIFSAGAVNVARLVSNLLAGIVFVDWLAVAPQCSRGQGFILLGLFGLTKFLQKFVPAT
jgi:4-hydroxybenzoate polyprenyltransferase